MKIGESDLPNALPWDEIGPSRYSASRLDPSLKEVLEEKSKERIAADRDMEFLKIDIEKVRARIESGKISLNESSRLLEKKRMTQGMRSERKSRIVFTKVPNPRHVLSSTTKRE